MSFHNPGNDLDRAIESLRWQTFKEWELILLDDGSTDGSGGLAQELQDKRISFNKFANRAGLAARLNQGVNLARGKYIARMDADDVSFPDRLERQFCFLESNKRVDLLSTSTLMVDKSNQPLGVLVNTVSHERICHKAYHGFPMPHPTWMGKADWFRRNRYNENAFKGQDQALLLRAYKQSCFASLPDVLLAYKYSGLSIEKTIIGRYYYLRELLKYGSINLVCAGFASHGLAAIRDLLAILIGKEAAVIKGRTTSAGTVLKKEWERLLCEVELRLEPIPKPLSRG